MAKRAPPSPPKSSSTKVALDYRAAGVDIDAGDALVERIKPYAKKTRRPEVLGGLGGFGALFELPLKKYKRPVLVSGTDGVGTKLKLAITLGIHDTIGIDLVAMCVNDILTSGAEPLFFLDYYATGKLDIDVAEAVIKGIADGCEQAGAALVGGETAEMPGMYHAGDYDLAGFSVGIVDYEKIIDGSKVEIGNVLIGLPSSGPHSNGYSLIRKAIEVSATDLHQACDDTTLAKALLAPTRIYVKTILALLKKFKINAMCHITGGGLLENLPRVLPQNTVAIVDTKCWQMPTVFKWLQHAGNIETREMHRTFNCGIGFVLCVKPKDADTILKALDAMGETAFIIGSVQHSNETEPHVILR